MKQLIFLVIFIPFMVNAQIDKGIKFSEGLTWQQVLSKAKSENKYIFVDCYATWCGPCKYMDKEVYTKRVVGDLLNEKFISVKVQMDTSKQDNELIKRFYQEAADINLQYKITAFPSYLFFSPEGKIVHRYLGAMPDTLFLQLASNALTPNKQYYTLLDRYKLGERDSTHMLYLSNITKKIGNMALANTIARDYFDLYLNKLSRTNMCTRRNIEFLTSFSQLLCSKDKAFELFYLDGDTVDRIMDSKGFSEYIVEMTIVREEINPRLWPEEVPIAGTPDWQKLMDVITRKFNRYYAENALLNAQLRWYTEKKAWPEVAKYNILKIEKNGLDTIGMGKFFTNNMIWNVMFLHSNDMVVLRKGVNWMEIIVKATPNDGPNIDTYANLLYKIGRTKEALYWEERALKIAKNNKKLAESKKDSIVIAAFKNEIEIYERTIGKMRKNEPTWTVN
ncbi:thioredoxin family protein [Chitinophaga sp. MM2321]|uniref:thioredoxin family protein n=1 Tax=Chitinophaga sp. MM2321 TaxID=3137178 RepID=UPI0032D5744C